MKIGYIANTEDVNGVEYHRLYKPLSLIGHDVTRCVGVDKQILTHGFDVVIFNRVLPCQKQSEFIRDLQRAGTYVICDIDDTWVMGTDHYLSKVWERENMRVRTIGALMSADEVWVTHKLLADLVGNLNPNVHIMPNALDKDEEQWKANFTGNGRIGWVGGITHVKDVLLTEKAWGDILPVICGYQHGEPEWKKLSDRLPATYVKGMDAFNYAQLYEQFDIAIAPLTHTKFNAYKSNLKILEAGFKGKPIFAQEMHPYVDRHKGIYPVRSWGNAIRLAASMSAAQTQDEGQALMVYVHENYDIRKINERRLERLHAYQTA